MDTLSSQSYSKIWTQPLQSLVSVYPSLSVSSSPSTTSWKLIITSVQLLESSPTLWHSLVASSWVASHTSSSLSQVRKNYLDLILTNLALQAYFVMLIVARFGHEVVPWIAMVLGIFMAIASCLKFQNIIYMIPTSIILALRNTIGKL